MWIPDASPSHMSTCSASAPTRSIPTGPCCKPRDMTFDLQPPCGSTGQLPLISSFIPLADPSPHAVDVQRSQKTKAPLWNGNDTFLHLSPLPAAPGSSTRTEDVEFNRLPCEGAPLSYSWLDFNLNLKAWSQTGRGSAQRFPSASLELISLSACGGVDGKRETSLWWLQLRADIWIRQLSSPRPSSDESLTLRVKAEHMPVICIE